MATGVEHPHETILKLVPDEREPRSGLLGLGLRAVVAAVLLHAALIALILADWSQAAPPPPAAPIPVTLVTLPPPAPKPPPPKPVAVPKPPPAPPAPQQPITPRESGDDAKTEAVKAENQVAALPQPKPPEPAPAPKPEAAPEIGPKAAPEQQAEAKPEAKPEPAPSPTPDAPPDPKPLPPAPPEKPPKPSRATAKEPAAAKTETKAPAERIATLAPEQNRRAIDSDLYHVVQWPSAKGGNSDRDLSGDAYLNGLREIVDRHRVYPPASAFPDGRERMVVYNILVDPSGRLVTVNLVQPSGSMLVDEAAGVMIRNAAPFPPLPPDYPRNSALITVMLPIYPAR